MIPRRWLFRAFASATILLLAAVAQAGAQSSELLRGPLSLERSLELAVSNNPTFRSVENDAIIADWDVRSAYGALFPSASATGGMSWQGTGEPPVGGGLTLGDLGISEQPSYYFSSYGLGLNYRLDGQVLFTPGRAKRSREATTADIRTAGATLVLGVTRAYLEAVRQDRALTLAQQELERAQFNLRLAESQLEVGTVTLLDVRQAEVQVGRAEVEVLRSETGVETSRLRLFQQVGLEGDTEAVELTSEFPLFEPDLDFEVLFDMALQWNPNLESLRASREAAEVGVTIARSAYLPSLSLSAGIGGFTRQASSTDFAIAQAQGQVQAGYNQCLSLNEIFGRLSPPLPGQDCGSPLLTDEDIASINSANELWPFNFTKQPATASLTISLPIFQGLGRQRNVEAARVLQDDLNLQLRDQELALRADLQAGLAAVRAGYRAAVIEERNLEVAGEQRRLAQERYRVGSASFLDLVEAETVLAQSERARLNAYYTFHDALASLEALVGTPIR